MNVCYQSIPNLSVTSLENGTLVFGDSITKYQPTVLNDDHLLKIKVKCPVLFGHENGNLIVPPANLRK